VQKMLFYQTLTRYELEESFDWNTSISTLHFGRAHTGKKLHRIGRQCESRTHANIHIHIPHTCTPCICIYTYIYIFIYVNIYACTYMYYVYIYIHIHMHFVHISNRRRSGIQIAAPQALTQIDNNTNAFRIHVYDNTHSHVWYDSLLCATLLIVIFAWVIRTLYGVAMISRLLKSIGLFCKRAL